ncbi:MAG: PLP-dependent aminotransferase family protein [Desulfobacterales bacterium]|nr:PLP-dependent aminotransferase family protein [Desulfobacterales bacterium]
MVSIDIDKKSGKPLYVQIRDRIRQAIVEKELAPGDKLPTVAAFAKQVGVTQATIRRAMEDLKQQGLTRCHVGRGTFVSAPESRTEEPGAGQVFEPSRESRIRPVVAARQLRQGVSKGLCDLMSVASQPGVLDFAKGIPDPGLLDPGVFEEMVATAMAGDLNEYMGYGELLGMPELRAEIAERYAEKGVRISPDHVLITNGAQQGASIAARDAAEKKRHVIVKTPGFQGIVDAFVGNGNWVDTVIADKGMDVPGQLEAITGTGSHLLSICPDFHNPIGEETMAKQRKKIAAWAKKNNGIILSDEIFQDLRMEGQAPESMINLLGEDQTIIISSLSKSLMSGLRMGWMISSPRRIAEFARLKRLMGHGGPPLMQGVSLAFFRSGAYDSHLEKIRKIYMERRDVMLSCLDQLMPEGVEWTKPNGGFALWVTLPRGYSSVALLISVLDKGINLVPGPVFDMDQRFVNAFRLGWAWTDADQIVEGMEILADAIKELLRKPPGDAGLSGLGHF